MSPITQQVCRINLRLLVVLFFAFSIGSASAQTNTTWNPGTTSNWSDSVNWNNGVPIGDYNAFIGNGASPFSTANLDINSTVNNLTLDSGGVFITPGNGLTVQDTLTLSGAGSFVSGTTGAETLSANVIAGSGTISNVTIGAAEVDAFGGTLAIAGSSQSAIYAHFQVAAGSTLNLTNTPIQGYDPPTGVLRGGVIISGTLELDNANIQKMVASSITLDGPAARFVNQYGQNALANLSDIEAAGGLTLQNGATLSTNQPLFVNLAGIHIESGSALSIGGQLTNQFKTSTVDASTLNINGSLVLTNGDPTTSLTVRNGGVLNVHGDVLETPKVDGYINVLNLAAGSLAVVDGNLTNSASGVQNSVNVDSGSVLNVHGNLNTGGGGSINLTNGSSLIVGQDLNIASFSTVCSGSFCGKTVLQSGSVASVNGSTSNAGSVSIDGTSILNAKGGFTQTDGSMMVDGILNAQTNGVNIQGGTLTGTGVVNGNVIMAGMMSPGDAPGVFTINGNYTQLSSGTLLEQVCWIDGCTPSELQINGVANLDGTLAFSFLDDFAPKVGDSFILMTFFEAYGSFDTITGLNLGNNEHLDVFYDAHDIRVQVATPEPASGLLTLFGAIAILAAIGCRRIVRIAGA